MAKETKNQAKETAAPEPPKVSKASSGPTFEIAGNDPFVDGTVRFYASISKDAEPQKLSARPFIIEAADSAGLDTLKNYRTRAAGACDKARVAAADEAIKQFAKL